jgi:hypothetical protein
MTDPALERENSLALAMVQAMIGAVFTNLCGVSIDVGPSWVTAHFQLASPPSEEDTEDISDIVVDFSALVGPSCVIGGANEVSSTVRVGGGRPSELPGRVVFARKVG